MPAPPLNPEQWLEAHGDYLYRFALARLRSPAAAEDAVQETFMAALKGADRFSGQSSERTWLVGILKHKIVDYIRKTSREPAYENASDAEGVLDDFFDRKGHWKVGVPEWRINPRKAVEQQEFWKVFESCLAGLQGRMGLAFTLREIDGLPAESICKELEISATNLWVVLHRARGKLQICLTEKWFKANG